VALLNRGANEQKITLDFAALGGFATPNDGEYHNPPVKPLIDVDDDLRSIRFSVRAKNDAHIRLFSGDSYYTFVFGGTKNTQCWIRKDTETSKYPGTLVDVDVLDESAYVDLWVSVDVTSGRVAMGRGHNVGEGTITEFIDNAVIDPIDYVVRTGWGSTGLWRFADGDLWRFADENVPLEFEVLDLWDDASSLGTYKNSITSTIAGTAAAMYRVILKGVEVVL